jgi:hypothetical protein
VSGANVNAVVRDGDLVATLRTMIYAYPTFHRGMLEPLSDLEG